MYLQTEMKKKLIWFVLLFSLFHVGPDNWGVNGIPVPVSVMLPLDIIDVDCHLQNPSDLATKFKQLADGGVSGVMVDVWWGIVERNQSGVYKWTGYRELFQLIDEAGLKLQVIMSFHACGGNVGDQCNITLPLWILDYGETENPNIFYQDEQHNPDIEYLSLFAEYSDTVIDKTRQRTVYEIYQDYMNSFKREFSDYLSSDNDEDPLIDQVQIGLGPCGELRYPSYRGEWNYCGVGEFQSYDDYASKKLLKDSMIIGHPEWGQSSGPSNAGNYNSLPSDTGFFNDDGTDNYASEYGYFYLNWYFENLLFHGERILKLASGIFGQFEVPIIAKVAGIHWWYGSPEHAAELTSGYFNTDENNAYDGIIEMLSTNGAFIDFTCLEMKNNENGGCYSEPENLINQVLQACRKHSVGFYGENALDLCVNNCNIDSFSQIIKVLKNPDYSGIVMHFTYLRMTDSLMNNQNNWQSFVNFVNQLKMP